MGYHIILRHDQDSLKHHYVEDLDKLASFSIREDAIIYQGEPHWEPVIAKQDKRYERFTHDWYRAGIKAQELFKEQAIEKKYMLEALSQDQKSFKYYTGPINKKGKYIKIKRGDFLIRNAANIEVDVKCRTFHDAKAGGQTFEFNAEDLVRHLNMSNYTRLPIVIAVYEREPNTDCIIADSLRMIDVEYMKKIIGTLALTKHERKNAKGEGYEAYQIPVSKTMKGFALIDYHNRKMTP